MLTATLYPIHREPEPLVLKARSPRSLRRQVEAALDDGFVLEPANLDEARDIVNELGIIPRIARPMTRLERVVRVAGGRWARRQDNAAKRDRQLLEWLKSPPQE